VSEEKDKPVLDQQMLGKLLEAAYVLQEHNRAMQKLGMNLERQRERLNEQTPVLAPLPPIVRSAESTAAQDDYTFTLAQIVETQRLVQVRRLGLEEAMLLVAERVASITKASGAGIGILEKKKVRYRAGIGELALPPGTEVPMEKALCVACIRTGQVIRCADVNPEFLLDAEECHRRGIAAIIAVPVYHDGGIAGGLEVYYPNTQAFTEQDVHSCQLMAGLVTEALARDEELSSKRALTAERALMLETAEKIKAQNPAIESSDTKSATVKKPAVKKKIKRTSPSSAPTFVCRKCGHELVGEERFCGNCGTPRGTDYAAPNQRSNISAEQLLGEPTPAASLTSQSAMAAGAHTHTSTTRVDNRLTAAIQEDLDFHPAPLAETDIAATNLAVADLALAEKETTEATLPEWIGHERTTLHATHDGIEAIDAEYVAPEYMAIDVEAETSDRVADSETALVTSSHGVAWTSAANAREFLEQLAASEHPNSLVRFWKARRADIYLAIAVILVIVAIRWGIWSNPAVGATTGPATSTAHHKAPAPENDLSFFDRMLISLGLADPPPEPENKGNPDTKVWVDLHTALYYCPGSDLYGKTVKGKFVSQRDAQLDQFEPALRKNCD
jgi:GAF domain-containing protein